MAHTDSILAARDRLNLSVSAVHAFAQIISQTSSYLPDIEAEISCVLSYIADKLSDDRDALEAALVEKVSLSELHEAGVLADSAISVTPANGQSSSGTMSPAISVMRNGNSDAEVAHG